MFNRFKSKKVILSALIFLALGIGGFQYLQSMNSKGVTYETAKVEKGNLVVSVSTTGTITTGNSVSVSTKASGVVKTVYVTNGDKVKDGQKIADVTLDEYALSRSTAAFVAYQDTVEAAKLAKKGKVDADIAMWQAHQDIIDAKENIEYKNINKTNPQTHKDYTEAEKAIIDKSLPQAELAFEAAELKYNNADSEIAAASAKVASSWRDYQENSATIYASSNGIISDLFLAPGLVLNANSSTSNTTGSTIVSAQTVAKISNEDQLLANVSLTEIDVIKVKANQNVTLTLDAYEDKTFTGKVLAVNTAGSVSSGVTSYPVTIILDKVDGVEIYPNMAVSAEIITDIQNDVLLIPTSAITTSNGQSSVQVKDGETITSKNVEVGSANDSHTVIKSGLSEAEEVVTATINNTASSTSTTTSPFSGLNRNSTGSTRSSGGNIQIGGPPGGF